MRALGCRGNGGLLGATANRAVRTCRSGSKDRRLSPKPPLLSAKVAQGDGGTRSLFLVGRCLPAYVPELVGGRSLES